MEENKILGPGWKSASIAKLLPSIPISIVFWDCVKYLHKTC